MKFVRLTLAKKIDDTGIVASPVGKSTIYSSADKEIVALITISNLSGRHNVRWDWYSPDAKLYYSTGNATAKSSENSFIKTVTLWHRLSIAGEKAAGLFGQWEIHVFLDDERIAVQSFHLMEPRYVISLPEEIQADYQYNKWGLIMGIEKYPDLPEVPYAERDLLAVKEYWTRVLGVPESNLITLLGKETTRSQVESYVTQYLPPNMQNDSILYVYFAGHGLTDTASSDPYLIPYDGNPKAVKETCYSLKKLQRELRRIKNKRTYLFMDTCFNGYAARKQDNLVPEEVRKKSKPKFASTRSKKVISFVATSGEKPCNTYQAMQQGLFTYYLLRGIRGEADVNDDYRITVEELYQFVWHNVSNGAKQMRWEQQPVITPSSKRLKKILFGMPKMKR